MREIGHVKENVAKLSLQLFQAGFSLLELLTQIRHFREERRRILARGLGLANGPGAAITLVLQGLRAYLHVLALRLQRREAGDVQLEAARHQSLGDGVQLGTEKLGIKHESILFTPAH